MLGILFYMNTQKFDGLYYQASNGELMVAGADNQFTINSNHVSFQLR